ncbi:MAG: hypothetical protein I8H72_03310 [Myxococcaceae bacterium]|nr:hypothetical protein [Myxococcaceae bacterium]
MMSAASHAEKIVLVPEEVRLHYLAPLGKSEEDFEDASLGENSSKRSRRVVSQGGFWTRYKAFKNWKLSQEIEVASLNECRGR